MTKHGKTVVVAAKAARVTGNGMTWTGRLESDSHLRDGLRFRDCVSCGVDTGPTHENGLCRACAGAARGDF